MRAPGYFAAAAVAATLLAACGSTGADTGGSAVAPPSDSSTVVVSTTDAPAPARQRGPRRAGDIRTFVDSDTPDEPVTSEPSADSDMPDEPVATSPGAEPAILWPDDGCSADNSATPTESAEGPAPVLERRADSANSPLPDLAVRRINCNGGWVNLRNELPSDRPLLVWFWAPH